MDSVATSTVMNGRLSWRKFDQMRKSEGLVETPTRKRSCPTDENTPPPKRKHASPVDTSKKGCVDESINWSDLAKQHGFLSKNGGQSIKEFVCDHNALKSKEGHSVWRKRKTLPGGVPFPMHRHSLFHKRKIIDQIESGETAEGIPVPTMVSIITD